MDNINTIKDTRVRVKLSKVLVDIIINNKARIEQIPKTISVSLQDAGIDLGTGDVAPAEVKRIRPTGIDVQLLNYILSKHVKNIKSENTTRKKKTNSTKTKSSDNCIDVYLYLSDLQWLNQFLCSLREKSIIDVHLNDLLESCHLELPQNEVIQRNAALEARCKILRAEQQNREYRKMTKDVDATLKHYPEDTIAYQMNAINSQIIAVLQFIFSVAAGFVFGFLGVELIIGNLDFGLRLLLGVMMALIIALAEIYFLAKKLNEYDNTVDTANIAIHKNISANVKPESGLKAHKD